MTSNPRALPYRLLPGLALFLNGAFSVLAQPTAGDTNALQTADSQARARLSFGLDGFDWLQVSWLGNPLWQGALGSDIDY